MKINKEYLKVVLLLTSLHSLFIGIGMIVMPNNIIEIFGFTELGGSFFRTQGGVFHIVMALGYFIASMDIANNPRFIVFIILVKFCATVFLVIYYLFVDSVIVILLSGIVDFVIGLVIFYLRKDKIKLEIKQARG